MLGSFVWVTHVSVHVGTSHEECAIVVRPLLVTLRRAPVVQIGCICHVPGLVIQKRRRRRPVPDLLSPVGIS